ncbi:MAG: peptidase domain-containing ABC transporter [Gemmatimonadaceae bacterium]|jgi:ATP-binding cassette subfamily B protein|nr:peptidase domain-containing ABC transporter [Gemmatimonadaceae bacterium]
MIARRPLRRFPRVRQHDVNDCGPACLVAIARHFGLAVSIAQVRQLASTDRLGTSVAGLLHAARELGFAASGVRVPPAHREPLALPAIAHLLLPDGLTHFVVLLALHGTHATIMDPRSGRVERTTRDALGWTGVLLLLHPAARLVPGRRTVTPLRRLAAIVASERRRLGAALAGAAAYTLLGLLVTVLVQQIVDRVVIDGAGRALDLLAAGMLALVALQAVVGVARARLTARSGLAIDARLVTTYAHHALHLPQGVVDGMRIGDLLARVNDAVRVRLFVNDVVVGLAVNALLVLGSLALLAAYSWRLAAVALALLPFHALVFAVGTVISRRVQRAIMERNARLETAMVEALSGLATIKRLRVERIFQSRIEQAVVRLLRASHEGMSAHIASATTADVLARIAVVATLWVGARLVMSNALTTGELFACYAIVSQLSAPVAALVTAHRPLQDALIAADRLFEIIELRGESAAAAVADVTIDGDLRFDDVCFGYGARPAVLSGISFAVQRGSMTAIVGGSGSGKSTLAALVQRIHELRTGSIRIGDVDIRELPLPHLRHAVVVVPQHLDLFEGTIAENVALDDATTDPVRVARAIADVGLGPFVRTLPEGLQTRLGERGLALSGGQRQRLCIARALYRQPRYLILDEATSALDVEAEHEVMETLRRLVADGVTVLLITHRLATAAAADQVVVLHEGRIVQCGPPAVLLEEHGQYARLWHAHGAVARRDTVPRRHDRIPLTGTAS